MISMLKTRSRMLLVVTTAMIALCGAQHALAQHGAIMVINNDDDGNGPMISHFSMPDLTELRAPDFTKRDLPTFQEKLVLSEAQLTAFERQIEDYLETFEKLKKDLLSVPGAEPMVLGKLAGLDLKSADGVAGESGPTQPLDDGADEPFWAMDGIDPQDMPEGLSLSVGVSVGGDDEESAVAAGQPSVAINFATRDGEEIPEEVRKKLEKAAAEMAEQIKQQIEQQIAEGKVPGKPEGGPGVLGPARAEDLKKRQEELEAAAKAFRKAKADLRQTFVLDAQTKLTTDQVERWPALERALLRSKSLPKGRLNGERTDLFKVLKSVNVDASAQGISSELESYELSLDAALKQRNDYLEDLGQKVDKAMEERNWDRALSLLERGSSLRVAVRSINQQFAQAITDQLPAELAAKFSDAVDHASYPQLFRQTFAEKTFAAVRGMDGIAEDTSKSLQGLEQAYRAERNDIDSRIRKAIDRYQPEEPLRPIESLKAMSNGAEPQNMMQLDEQDPIRDAFAKRRELDQKYAASVKALLSPAQAERLPKLPVRKPMGEPIIIRKTSEQ